jgi:hypothetical protein
MQTVEITYVIPVFTLKIVGIPKLFTIPIILPLKLDFIENMKIKAIVVGCGFRLKWS